MSERYFVEWSAFGVEHRSEVFDGFDDAEAHALTIRGCYGVAWAVVVLHGDDAYTRDPIAEDGGE